MLQNKFDDETQELIDWFYANFDKLPQEPFNDGMGTTYGTPWKWYNYLKERIEQGPESAENRFGGLKCHLKKMKYITYGS